MHTVVEVPSDRASQRGLQTYFPNREESWEWPRVRWRGTDKCPRHGRGGDANRCCQVYNANTRMHPGLGHISVALVWRPRKQFVSVNDASEPQRGLYEYPLATEEALGKRRNEADFDDQSHERLERRYHRHRVIQGDAAREEAAPVETGHAEHDSA